MLRALYTDVLPRVTPKDYGASSNNVFLCFFTVKPLKFPPANNSRPYAAHLTNYDIANKYEMVVHMNPLEVVKHFGVKIIACIIMLAQ